MLTKSQRDSIESGGIDNDEGMRYRVRQRIKQTIEDFDIVFRNENRIRKRTPIWSDVDDQKIQSLIINLFDKLEDCWRVPGQEIQGYKQQLAIYLMVDAFDGYDPENESNVKFEEFDMSEEIKEIVDGE